MSPPALPVAVFLTAAAQSLVTTVLLAAIGTAPLSVLSLKYVDASVLTASVIVPVSWPRSVQLLASSGDVAAGKVIETLETGSAVGWPLNTGSPKVTVNGKADAAQCSEDVVTLAEIDLELRLRERLGRDHEDLRRVVDALAAGYQRGDLGRGD